MRSFAVIPAAGQSLRMGTPKLLLPWRGQSVIDHVLQAWIASRVTRVAIVVRHDDRELIARCEPYDVDVIRAEPNPEDMRASVVWGLRHFAQTWSPAPDDVWLLAPADLPRLSSTVIDRLLDEAADPPPCVWVASCDGQRGHPVVVPWSRAARVESLPPGSRVKAAWADLESIAIEVGSPGILHDLDTPADAARLLGDAPASG